MSSVEAKKKDHLFLIYKVIASRKVCLLIHPSTHSSSQHTGGKWAEFTEKDGEASVTYKKMLKFTFESNAVSLLILAKIKHLIRKGNS